VQQVEVKTTGFRLWHAYCHLFGGASEVRDETTVDRIVAPTISRAWARAHLTSRRGAPSPSSAIDGAWRSAFFKDSCRGAGHTYGRAEASSGELR
jgi:hypothetical protein